MIFLFTIVEVSVAVGIVATLSGLITPLAIKIHNRHKTRKIEREKRNAIIDSLPDKLEKINTRLSSSESCALSLKKHFDKFEVHQLKYIINDAFFGYKTAMEIPQEVLVNASECCDSYLGKGLNHEIGARCKIIYKEIERRELEKSQCKESEECDDKWV